MRWGSVISGLVVGWAMALQALPAAAQTFTVYRCRDGAQFALAFFEYDKRAHLQLDGKALTLAKRLTLSGVRYAKGDVSLRIVKNTVTLKRGRRVSECEAP